MGGYHQQALSDKLLVDLSQINFSSLVRVKMFSLFKPFVRV